MCLSIPSRVISINGDKAIVSTGGTEYEASLQLLEDVKVDDYVLVHTGFAIQKISEKEALETLELFKEIDALEDQIDLEEKNKQ